MEAVDKFLRANCENYINSNKSALKVVGNIKQAGIGWFQLIDHVIFRIDNVEIKAKQLVDFGYSHIDTLEFNNWWGNIYALKGRPLVFIDQAYEGEKGEGSLIKEWVNGFGDKIFHHIAI